MVADKPSLEFQRPGEKGSTKIQDAPKSTKQKKERTSNQDKMQNEMRNLEEMDESPFGG